MKKKEKGKRKKGLGHAGARFLKKWAV